MSDIRFSILCPTRKRPHNMELLTKSIIDTAHSPEVIEIIFYIDDDDDESLSKSRELSSHHNVRSIVGKRIVLSQMWNICHQHAVGEIFMHCGDDIIMRTSGWDSIVFNAFEEIHDKIAFVYGDDMNPGVIPNFGTHGFIHRNWTDTIGYFVPPYFSSDWNDTWLNDVAKMLNRHYQIPIQTEHMHPGAGKGVYDITHKERLERGRRDKVEQMYYAYHHERVRDAEKLAKFISDYST